MKRLVSFFVMCLALLMAGCAVKNDSQDAVEVYFRTVYGDTGGSVIDCEYRETDNVTAENMVEMLLWGPIDEEKFSATFPIGLEVEDIVHENTTVMVKFSEEFSRMKAIDRSIATACVVNTLTQLEDVDRVILSYPESDGERFVESYDDTSFELLTRRNTSVEYSVNIYYVSSNGKSLEPESETLVAAERDSLERFILDELVSGPRSGELAAALPEGTEILDVYTDNNTCYVNMNSVFHNSAVGVDSIDTLRVYSIVNSLADISSIDRVQILIEGEILNYYGSVPISAPLEFDKTIVRSGDTGLIEVDIYLKRSRDDYLSPRFRQIRQVEFASAEQLIVEELLNMDMPEGYDALFPEGTELRTIATRDAVCYVDLTEEFLQGGSKAVYGAQAIAASLVQLDSVDAVQITCEGRPVKTGTVNLPTRYDEVSLLL